MLNVIRRFLLRRALCPVVSALPRLLLKSYGDCKFYTAGQVRRAAEKLKLAPPALPYAFALALEESEFSKAAGLQSPDSYLALREALFKVFDIHDTGATAQTLNSARYAQLWNPPGLSLGANLSSYSGNDTT
jgi:hypothetical protein